MATKTVTPTRGSVEAGLQELKVATSQLARDVYSHEQAIRDAQASISQAKGERDAALDAGDTAGFEKSMSNLRKSNEDLARLQRAGNWQSRLAELDDQHKTVIAAARAEQTASEAAMLSSRAAFEKAHERTRQAQAALGPVNEVRRIIESQSVTG